MPIHLHKPFRFLPRANAAFTLIETAIAVTVFGILLASAIQVASPLMYQRRLTVTEQRMQRIVDVLSIYAQRNNRIPCPANLDPADTAQPMGAEVGSGVAGDAIPAISASPGCETSGIAFNEGVVPYRTLGLGPDDIRDGWNRYFTYHVNANYVRNPTAAISVHAWCRTSSWVPAGINQNPMRARFCCGQNVIPAQAITVEDSAGVSLFPFFVDPVAANYATANTAYAGPSLSAAANNVTTIAFVLVSHGPNGAGAFTDAGTRTPATATTGTGELENMNGDLDFVWAQRSASLSSNHFENVIIWRTQDQLYAETGSGSCALP